MKKLVLILAGISVAGSAYAQDTTVKFGGEIRARYKNEMNENGGKKTQPVENESHWQQRSLLGFTASKGENLTGHIKFLAASEWGRTTTDITTNGTDDSVALLESWIWWKTSDMMSLKLGRGGMTIADGAVVSTNDYEQIPRVFEGVLAAFDFGFAGLNVFGVKASEFGTSANQLTYDKEGNFYGFSFDFKNLPDAIKMANLHLIKDQRDIQLALAGTDYLRLGATVGGDVAGFDFKGTYAMLSGTTRSTTLDKNNDTKVSASMFDLAAGYTLPDMMGMRFGAVFHSDTGDKSDAGDTDDTKNDQLYTPFHYNSHDYAGKMDIIGWGNLTYFGVNFAITPVEKTTLGIDWLSFSRTSAKDTPYSDAGAGTASTLLANAAAADADKKGLGSEIDIWASHAYTDAFSVGARLGMFSFGDYNKKNAANETREGVTDFWLSASYKF